MTSQWLRDIQRKMAKLPRLEQCEDGCSGCPLCDASTFEMLEQSPETYLAFRLYQDLETVPAGDRASFLAFRRGEPAAGALTFRTVAGGRTGTVPTNRKETNMNDVQRRLAREKAEAARHAKEIPDAYEWQLQNLREQQGIKLPPGGRQPSPGRAVRFDGRVG